ncbi:MAG: phosphoribosylformimino-5-aminoimidazole carboxamide ribotide isomerase [Chloroflexota bacterium]|nr:phosphoribosylformimino-5-aminoimidazole carboxamide ribotide isomerase [Chloroflexota bacterium]
MSRFELLPAIDLIAGRVVRLRKGDFDQETSYGDNPVAVARAFADAGAGWLHVVDLDGARAGEPRQLGLAAAIVAEVHGQMRVEIGGGLRTAEAVAGALGTGAARAVIGTALLRDPDFGATLVARHGPDRLVASIDVRDGLALGEGWREGAPGLPASDAVSRLAVAGIETFEVTAIERDGLLEGPDLDLLRRLVGLERGRIIASGGISSVDDVLAAQAAGCAGAIVGRALYEERIDLRALVTMLEGGDHH